MLDFFDNPRTYPKLHARTTIIRKANGQEAIVLDNGGSFELVARSRGSGRGFSVDVLVLDEAQELFEEEMRTKLFGKCEWWELSEEDKTSWRQRARGRDRDLPSERR